MTCLQGSFWGHVAHVIAVLMLVVSGGLYAHADTGGHGHEHDATAVVNAEPAKPSADHAHMDVSGDEAGSAAAMLHCGADIHFPAMHAPVFGVPARQVLCADEAIEPGNALLLHDPPPPRFLS